MGTCYSSTKDDISEAEVMTYSQVSQPRKHVYVNLRAASKDAKLFKDEEFHLGKRHNLSFLYFIDFTNEE